MSAKKGKRTGHAKPKIVCVFKDGDGFTLEVVEEGGAKTKRIRGRNPVVLCSETDWSNLITFVKTHADQEG
jgi:hypothetical protein